MRRWSVVLGVCVVLALAGSMLLVSCGEESKPVSGVTTGPAKAGPEPGTVATEPAQATTAPAKAGGGE